MKPPHIAIVVCRDNLVACGDEVGMLTLSLAIRRVEVHKGAARNNDLSAAVFVVCVKAVQNKFVLFSGSRELLLYE